MVDVTPMATDDLVGRTRDARSAWEAAVAEVGPDRLTEPHAPGAWATRDVIAHLTADQRWMAGQLRALVRGELPTAAECYGHDQVPPPTIDLGDQNQRNAWRHEIDRHRPLDEVLANAPLWADALEDAIGALPDGWLATPHTFGEHGHIAHIRRPAEGESAWPLVGLISAYADEHYESHAADLRAWLDDAERGGRGL